MSCPTMYLDRDKKIVYLCSPCARELGFTQRTKRAILRDMEQAHGDKA